MEKIKESSCFLFLTMLDICKNKENSMDLCKECNKRALHIKKRKLCAICYQRLRRSGECLSPTGKTISYKGAKEIEFVRNYFNHKNWIHHPATFHIENEIYSPDFYDGEINTFIEVVGTRQAYHKNKHKYDLFRKIFPLLKFEIRTSDGKLLQNKKNRIAWTVLP